MAVNLRANISTYSRPVAFRGNMVIEMATEEAVKELDCAFKRKEITDMAIKACHDISKKEIRRMPLYWCIQKYAQARNSVVKLLQKLK